MTPQIGGQSDVTVYGLKWTQIKKLHTIQQPWSVTS